MSKIIIAVCGLAGSGKDTACDYLVRDHGFMKTSFAAPLKEMAKIAFGFTDEQLYGPSSKREEEDTRYPFSGTCPSCGMVCTDYTDEPEENPLPEGHWYECVQCQTSYKKFVTPRLALQTLGTEWGRRLTPNLWASAAVNRILLAGHDRWCLSDLRFRNELDAVHGAGGKVVRLTRGSLSYNHASETGLAGIPLDAFDAVIDNTGTIGELHWKLNQIYKDFTR